MFRHQYHALLKEYQRCQQMRINSSRVATIIGDSTIHSAWKHLATAPSIHVGRLSIRDLIHPPMPWYLTICNCVADVKLTGPSIFTITGHHNGKHSLMLFSGLDNMESMFSIAANITNMISNSITHVIRHMSVTPSTDTRLPSLLLLNSATYGFKRNNDDIEFVPFSENNDTNFRLPTFEYLKNKELYTSPLVESYDTYGSEVNTNLEYFKITIESALLFKTLALYQAQNIFIQEIRHTTKVKRGSKKKKTIPALSDQVFCLDLGERDVYYQGKRLPYVTLHDLDKFGTDVMDYGNFRYTNPPDEFFEYTNPVFDTDGDLEENLAKVRKETEEKRKDGEI